MKSDKTYKLKSKDDYNRLVKIKDYILETFNVDLLETKKRRKRELVELRVLFFALAKERTRLSYVDIADYLGKDHATVVYSLKMWRDFIHKNYQSYFDAYLTTPNVELNSEEYITNLKSKFRQDVIKEYDYKLSKIKSQADEIISQLNNEKDKQEILDKLKIIVKAKIRMNQVEHIIK